MERRAVRGGAAPVSKICALAPSWCAGDSPAALSQGLPRDRALEAGESVRLGGFGNFEKGEDSVAFHPIVPFRALVAVERA